MIPYLVDFMAPLACHWTEDKKKHTRNEWLYPILSVLQFTDTCFFSAWLSFCNMLVMYENICCHKVKQVVFFPQNKQYTSMFWFTKPIKRYSDVTVSWFYGSVCYLVCQISMSGFSMCTGNLKRNEESKRKRRNNKTVWWIHQSLLWNVKIRGAAAARLAWTTLHFSNYIL